jgi:hypothetical protein
LEKWAYDLRAMASEFRESRRFKDLTDAIDRYHSAFSVHADLLEAKRAIDTLHEVEKDESERFRFAAALMTHAVAMYARATISDQDGRRPVDVTRSFPEELKHKHAAIADLRNTVVAHYGVPKGSHAHRWNDERTVLRWHPEGRSFSYLSRRAGFVAEAVNDLAILTRHAGLAVAAAIDERELKLRALLKKFENDPEVAAVAQRCRFKPEAFYKTEVAVDAFWHGVGSE